MANRESRVDIVLKAKAEGLQQLQQQTDQFAKSISNALEQSTKGFAATNASLLKFGQSFSQVSKSITAGGIAIPSQAAIAAFGQPPRFMPTPGGGGGGGGFGGGGGMGGRPPGGGGGPGGPGGSGPGGSGSPGDKMELDLGPVVEGLDALKDGIAKLIDQVSKQTSEQSRSRQKSEETQRKHEGTFTHGLLQTTLPTIAAPFLARGPGMKRETFGQLAGSSLSGVLGGLGNIAVSGMGGLQEAIKGIPLPGTGMVSGLLGAAASYRDTALQREQMRFNTMPWLQNEGVGARAQRANTPARRAQEETGLKQSTEFMGEHPTTQNAYGRISRQIWKARLARKYKEIHGMPQSPDIVQTKKGTINTQSGQFSPDWPGKRGEGQGWDPESPMKEMGAQLEAGPAYEQVIGLYARKMIKEDPEFAVQLKGYTGDLVKERFGNVKKKQAGIHAKYALPSAYGSLRGAGLHYGAMAEPEALQFAAGVTQAGGGGRYGMQRAGMTQAAFAAHRVYGMDEGTIGSFLKAQRRGGLAGMEVGGAGMGGATLTSTIGDAMKLGLEGSELNNYMKIVADGIQQFEQSGIPFAKDSFAGMADEMAKMGASGPRGAFIARGVTQAAQGLSSKGPQNAADLMMMQTMGGYQGGGAESFEAAQLQMEQGKMDPKNMTKLFQRYMKAGGGGASGRQLFRHVMGGMGVQIGVKESQLMGAQMEGNLSADQQKELEGIQAQRSGVETKGGVAGMGTPAHLEALLKQAEVSIQKYGGTVAAQAELANKQADLGSKMMKPMRDFEEATMNLAEGITTLIQKPLDWFASHLKDGSEAVKNFTDSLNKSTSIFDLGPSTGENK